MSVENISKRKVIPWKLGWLNLPEVLKGLLLIAILTVLVYHTQQYCEQAKVYLFTLSLKAFAFCKVLLEFTSKLAYAIITSSIFYYITQQIPKENKRIKFADSLFNIFGFVQTPFRDFETEIFRVGDIVPIPSVVDDYIAKCRELSFANPVRPNMQNSINWETYTLNTLKETLNKVEEINPLSDLLDSKTYISLQKIKSLCITANSLMYLRNHGYVGDSTSLGYIGSLLFELRKEIIAFNSYAESYCLMYTGSNLPIDSMKVS